MAWLHHVRLRHAAPEHRAAGWDATLTVTVTVANTGKRAGEEVVQLYVHDRVASRVRPVRELKNFQKILLSRARAPRWCSPDRHALAFTGVDGVLRAEPGLFDLWVASSCTAGEAVQFELLPA
jgi:beta-glucosidase